MAGNGVLQDLRLLTPAQRNAVLASFLGWTLDAFDFFILVFVLPNIAHDFGVGLKDAAYCITLTLALRPVGALVFGMLADRFGRKPILMLVILLYSGFEASCAFAPNLMTLLILRAGFGFAMGGEWGIGASLAMETIPERTRGIVSGFLQEGYATGYLLAAILFWVAFPHIGWRGMFLVGALPAVLAIYMFFTVEESPTFQASRHSFGDMVGAIARNWKMFLYIVLVMTCFNAFSHGTQDLYPTFLGKGLGFPSNVVAKLAIVANIGAIVGGVLFGAYSERIGRRRAIVIAALLCLPVIPLWALSHGVLALAAGAFLMQFCVQGAWGVIPAHLNEMSPPEVRGTFPGFTYQLGNFLVSKAAPLQVALATYWSGDYGLTLAVSAAGVAVAIAVVVGLGRERKGTSLAG